jgi:hypothetical protein
MQHFDFVIHPIITFNSEFAVTHLSKKSKTLEMPDERDPPFPDLP